MNFLSRGGSGDEPERRNTLPDETNAQPGHDFLRFVRATRERFTGLNGHNEVANFIPRHDLETYWKNGVIKEVCKAYRPPLTTARDTIKTHYLKIFSILIYIGKGQYLTVFTENNIKDAHLPFSGTPEALQAPMYDDLMNSIKEHQWLFCPLVLNYAELSNVQLEPSHILPFHGKEELATGDFSNVFKVKVYSACDELIESSSKSGSSRPGGNSHEIEGDRTYVIKSYDTAADEQTRRLARCEAKALTALKDSKNVHIIGYYGSFTQNGRHHLILQFANGGDMSHFFETQPRPKTTSDILQFWKSLFNIFQGLHCVHHQLMIDPDNKVEFQGIHQDLKPDNILLSKASNGSTPFDFTLMLADFGHTDLRPINPDQDDGFNLDRHGNQVYSSPESSHHAGFTRGVPNHITPAADIWSAGCLLSDAANWLVFGQEGFEEYEDERFEETKTIERFQGNSSNCFHNAIGMLNAVKLRHERIRKENSPEDLITPRVVDLVEKRMLLDNPKERYDARHLYELCMAILPQDVPDVGPEPQPTPTSPGAQLSSKIQGVFNAAQPQLAEAAQRISTVTNVFRGRGKVSRHLSLSGAAPSDEGSAEVGHSQPPKLPLRPGTLYPMHDFESDPGVLPSRQAGLSSPMSEASASTLDPNYLTPQGRGSSPSRNSFMAEDDESVGPPPGDGPEDYLTIEEALRWHRQWKNYEPYDKRVHEIVRSLRHHLQGREHFFFVDDSRSMRQYHKAVIDAFQILAYIVKPSESSGKGKSGKTRERGRPVSLVFASHVDSGQLHVSSDTTELLGRVERCEYVQMARLMEDKLSWLVENILIDKLPEPKQEGVSPSKPRTRLFGKSPANPVTPDSKISLVIFTDGRWGDDSNGAMGVQNPINRLIARINELGLPRTHVMIQFVQFGDDEVGTRHLRFLVENGQRQGLDIVDTQPVSGSIPSMLIGSISRGSKADFQQSTWSGPSDLASQSDRASLSETYSHLDTRKDE